jgi:hypothetical protein
VSDVTAVSPETTLPKGGRRGPWRTWHEALRWDRVSTALTLIILGGAVARFAGGSWGLPVDLNPDEWVIVHGAVDMARRHSFEPSYFFRPDHVEMKLSNLAYLVYSHLLHGSSPETLFASDPAPFIMISRAVTACFGVAMIAVAYLIGTRFNRAIGLLAAFSVAFFPPFVDHSHLATPDVPLSFAFMIVILGCMRYLTTCSWGNLLLASLGVSVAIAIKYPGALGALMIAIVVVVSGVQARAWTRILVHGAVAIAAVLGFLYVISPVLFTRFNVVASNVAAEAGDTHLGADNLGWLGNLRFYAEGFATSAGLIMLVCFALGVLWSVRLRLQQSIPLWSGAVVWLILSRVPLHWERWALPMDLTPLLMAPIGAYYSFRYLLDKGAAPWLRWGAVGLGAVLATNLMAGSVAVSAGYLAKDTRTSAGSFAANGVDDKNTIFEGYTPFLPGGFQSIFTSFEVIDGRLVLSSKDQNRSGLRYVVISSDMYQRYKAEPRYVAEQRFYALLDKQFVLLSTYDPSAHGEPTLFEIPSIRNALDYALRLAHGGLGGPTIKVYLIPADRR